MNVRAIDHVNVRVPEARVDEAVEFYAGVLGFEPEQLDAYRRGDRTLFSFRLGDTAVLHIRPVDEFAPPTGENYDHFALVVDATVGEIKERLADAGIDIRREGTPLGATGRAPAVYVDDPFGYVIELKEAGS